MSKRLAVLILIVAALGIPAVLVQVYRARVSGPEAPEVPKAAATSEFADADPDRPGFEAEPGALALAGRERADNGLGLTLCWCPPGSFRMGSLPGVGLPGPDEAPVRVTFPRGFWVGRDEVTQAQWLDVMGRTLREQRALDPDQPRPVGDGTDRDHVGEGPDHPIYFVNQAEAREFCGRLTERERAAGRLGEGQAYRLPSEAQWEYACRAGTTTAFAFGDQLSGLDANIDGTRRSVPDGQPGPYLRETTPVGRYRPNAWGLRDLHGNVWEWCEDGYNPTLPGGVDPLAPAADDQRPIRGGGWHNEPWLCRSASRSPMPADGRGSSLGFRVALIGAPGP